MDLIKPVYLRDREIQCGSTRISDFDLSMSVTKSISDLTCVQKDRDLWRIYVKSKESRSKILTEGIDIRNTNVKVFDTNPYSAGFNDPSDNVFKMYPCPSMTMKFLTCSKTSMCHLLVTSNMRKSAIR